jgi:hypothetical protein
MKSCRLFWGGVGIGTAMCLAAVLRVSYVRAAWEHTTFHPSYEMDTPGLFFGLGALFIVVSVVMALVDWAVARRAHKSNRQGQT